MGRLYSSINIISVFLLLFPFFHSKAYAKEAQDYFARGEELYRTHHLGPNHLEQAIGCFEKALSLKPDDYQILCKLSEIYHIYGQTLDEEQKQKKIALWKKGVTYGKQAAEADPEGKEGHFYYMSNMGALAKIQGKLTSILRFRKIKKEMDIIFALAPNYPLILVARAQYLTELPEFFGGDEEKARRLYHRILEIDPDFLIAYYYLAELDFKQKRYSHAISNLEKVIEGKGGSPSANWIKLDRPRAEKLLEKIMDSQ